MIEINILYAYYGSIPNVNDSKDSCLFQKCCTTFATVKNSLKQKGNMRRLCIRYISHFMNSPVRVFLLFLFLIYFFDAKTLISNILVPQHKPSHVEQPRVKDNGQDILGVQNEVKGNYPDAGNVGETSEKSTEHFEGHYDHHEEGIDIYVAKLKQLKPLNVQQDGFLSNFSRTCQATIPGRIPLCQCIPKILCEFLIGLYYLFNCMALKCCFFISFYIFE